MPLVALSCFYGHLPVEWRHTLFLNVASSQRTRQSAEGTPPTRRALFECACALALRHLRLSLPMGLWARVAR